MTTTDTLEVIASTGATISRDGFRPDNSFGPYFEALDIAGADLSRLVGAPLLVDHLARSDFVAGVVESAKAAGGNLLAHVRFSKEPRAQALKRDVVDRIRRMVSVGYNVTEWVNTSGKSDRTPTFTATRWQPLELSLVAIGADAGAVFRNTDTNLTRYRVMTVSTSAPAAEVAPAVPVSELPDPLVAERERVSGILQAARAFGGDMTLAHAMLGDGTALDVARTRLTEAWAARDRATATTAPYIRSGEDHSDPAGIAEAIAGAWASRCNANVTLDGRSQQFRGLRTAECLRQYLVASNIRPGTTEREIVKRAATTSDFPGILASALNKSLLPVYNTARSGLVELAAKDSVRDFKSASRLRAGEFPPLTLVLEHGEYTYGNISETKETFTLKKYGRIFAVTWEALVNDDLDALSAASRTGGLAAANLEADLLAERVNSNPTMADGVAVMNATHGNTGTAGVISTTTVGELTGKMRLQKGLDGQTILNITPKFLAVPSGLETVARQLVATISPVTTATDNSMFRGLTVVVDPRLDAGDVNGWYLFASPGVAPTLTLAHLEGEEGPVTESRNGFNIDAVEVKVRHVAAAYWADFRGVGYNIGA